MTHFGIAKLFNGKFEFLEGTREELVKRMNKLSNEGSVKYASIRVYPYSAYQTKRSFKQPSKVIQMPVEIDGVEIVKDVTVTAEVTEPKKGSIKKK